MAEERGQAMLSRGFAVGYAPGKGAFRVYICLVLAVVLGAVWYLRGGEIALVLAALFVVAGYYFYPLVETGKVRLGAGQYGVFIEGLGIVPWRAIQDIRLSSYAVRTLMVEELEIELATTLPKALMADWRSMPFYRLLMRLPWSMGRDNIVRVKLEPFAGRGEDIVAAIQRNRDMFGRSP